MSAEVDKVRASRDGDQFHYTWAARRCLRMLSPNPDLVAVVIEGVPALERDEVAAGIDAIDVAEYFGSARLDDAKSVRYLQLKHSTVRVDEQWRASELAKAFRDFASRYRELVERFGDANVSARFRFSVVTNRPFAPSLATAFELLRAGTHNGQTASIQSITGLQGDALSSFAKLVDLEGEVGDYIAQRSLLSSDLSAYLPERDRDAPVQLKELVTKRATSLYQGRPDITRHDVLEALGITEAELFPAKPLFDALPFVVDRTQIADIVEEIIVAPRATIIHADGGVGKSVVATRIGMRLPPGSAVFVYDCFGNGGYRSATGYRHRARDGLVQLANEMAAQSLCDPLIPAGRSEASSFVRAFMARTRQASEVVAARSENAILAIVIDAADNAQMAADELTEGPSFAQLLLRELFPENLRLVLTCRSHRIDLLTPPAGVTQIELKPFDEGETSAYLRSVYPKANDQDVREFHRLTSMNPRVQATAIASGGSLADVLRKLGPEPLTVKDTIAMLLEAAIAKLRSEAPTIEQNRIDEICLALATLRPFVPLEIVAKTANVPAALVRSLANDLQRPLLIRDDAIQFRDEPTETWFRERFRPDSANLRTFVERLLPHAAESSYVSAGLPQLMLEAGQFDELVDLALRGEALPENDELARRDVEYQRLQFALKAALRGHRFVEATKLAILAGGKAAADDRQQQLLSDNSDLGALFLEPERMLEQVSRRLITGGQWTGSEHAYRAAFLSGSAGLAGEARSQLRVAYEWLKHWATTTFEPHERKDVTAGDCAELALADINLHGPKVCAAQLRRWRQRERSFLAGEILVARLVDAARFDDVDALAEAAGNDLGLLLAICRELARVGRTPPKGPVSRLVKLVTSRHVKIRSLTDWQGDARTLSAVNAVVFAAIAHRVANRRVLAKLLTRYLPAWSPNGLDRPYSGSSGERTIYLRAYLLRASLRNRVVDIKELAPSAKRRTRKKSQRAQVSDPRRFNAEVGALLPWHQLWVDRLLSRIDADALGARIDAALAQTASAQRESYRERSEINDEVAKLRCEILHFWPSEQGSRDAFDHWLNGHSQPLFIPTWVELSRIAARSGAGTRHALVWATEAFRILNVERDHAQAQADSCISIARAVLPASRSEAQAYFDRAVEMSANVGDENLWRWDVMLHLAEKVGAANGDDPELGYRFARAAEVTRALVDRDKHFDWEHSIEALCKLSPRSAPAIISRWFDRRFGRGSRLLAAVVKELVGAGHLSPAAAVAMLPMSGEWDRLALLTKAMAGAVNQNQLLTLWQFCLRYLQLDGLDAGQWKQLVALGDKYGMDTRYVRKLLAVATKAERNSAQRHAATSRRTRSLRSSNVRRLTRVFAGLDPTVGSDMMEVLRRFRARNDIYDWEALTAEAMRRTPAGKEAEFLVAYQAADEINIYRLTTILEAMPLEWQRRAAVRPALQKLIRDVVRRDCNRISASNYYQPLQWELVERVSGLSRDDVSREAIIASGNHPMPLAADDLFRLAGLLSRLMSPAEARDALEYGLAIYDPMLQPEDADGDWRAELAPPNSVEQSLAGFLWCALASPWADRRWEAAHAIRGLLYLGHGSIVTNVVEWAEAKGGPAFTDRRYRHYDLNGLQWLLLALARSATESGQAVLAHAELLRKHASIDQKHVVIRSLARQALASLCDQGLLQLSADEDRNLLQPIAPIESISQPAKGRRRSQNPKRSRRKQDGTRFLFGIDFGPYWINPLSRHFEIEAEALESEMERIIRKDWGLTERGHWAEDARAAAGQFRDNEFERAQGSVPAVDDLSFYLSYHSLMVAAGGLLATTPLRAHEHYEESFDEWLEEQLLSRRDGLWLFDRRDPTPADLGAFPEVTEADWPDSQASGDVLHALQPDGRHWTIGGYWHRYGGKRSERTSIASALVSADRARALARALQLTDQNNYRLPDFRDSSEINKLGYVMEGWVAENGNDRRLDRRDPWSADMGSHDFGPGDPYAALISLTPSHDGRFWRNAAGQTDMHSQIWSDGRESEDTHYGGGHRLLVTRSGMRRLLKEADKSLVVEVRLKRDFVYTRYDYDRKDRPRGRDIRQIFVIEKTGAIWEPGPAVEAR